MTSTETSSLILHGRRRASIRLRDGVVLLAADGVQRRIPVAAIERIDVHGPKGRRLAVVLTGDEPVAYHLRCRSAPAVHEFAQAVQRALPLRDTDEPRLDGAGLVTEAPLERATPNRVRQLWWGLGGAYVLVLVLLVVTRAGVVPALLWVVAPEAIGGGGFGVHIGWKIVREAWGMRTRGITVEGRLQRSHWYNGVEQYTYAYVDNQGEQRELTSSDGGAERAEITYDPADPETAQVGRGTTGWLVFGAVLILLLSPLLLAGVWFAVVGVAALVV
ncbi:hypothetical protein ABZU86_13370 [Streptomyces sp. NPDC005271]|uniref:hypothetical protein n=1 Tax=unclassified Streptomyces TaxID=2593676 RepID=UPI00339E9723